MELDIWEPILQALGDTFPKLRRVSRHATALNLLTESPEKLRHLRELGLKLLNRGPGSGEDQALKRIAKGASATDHVEAAAKARQVGFQQSLIFLLGAGGTERSEEHATGSAKLATAMDPEFLSALTLMLIPSAPFHKLAPSNRFQMPTIERLLGELRTVVAETTRASGPSAGSSNGRIVGITCFAD